MGRFSSSGRPRTGRRRLEELADSRTARLAHLKKDGLTTSIQVPKLLVKSPVAAAWHPVDSEPSALVTLCAEVACAAATTETARRAVKRIVEDVGGLKTEVKA